MFIELLDLLRCPRPHEESWLVLAATRTEDRDVLEGVLGCPVCHAEYPIIGGVAMFASHRAMVPRSAPNEKEALRLAASLDLTTPRGYAVLVGEWGIQAPLVLAMTDVQLLLVNPPAGIVMGHGLSGLTVDDASAALPLAPGTARGLALDHTATPAQLASALAVVSGGGRVLAPATLPLPDGLSELARDDRHWIGERTTASSGVVSITRRR